MITSLTTGVSGLKSNQTMIDVTGNNISNVNTTGYKGSSASFNAVLGQRLMGTGRNAGGQPPHRSTVGRGVTVGSVSRSWEQGRLKTDNVSTHLGLTNDGFFVARSGDNRMLTRAGNFAFNSNGELVTSGGLQVQGYGFDDTGSAVMTDLKDVKIDLEKTAPPQQTSEVEIGGNLSSDAEEGLAFQGTVQDGDNTPTGPFTFNVGGDTVEITFDGNAGGDTEWDVNYDVTSGGGSGTLATVDFSNTLPTNLSIPAGEFTGSQNVALPIDISGMELSTSASTDINKAPEASQSVKVYDGTGESHTLNMRMFKTEDATAGGSGEWSYELYDDAGNTVDDGWLKFDTEGKLTQINGNAVSGTNGFESTFTWDIDGNGSNEQLTLNFGDDTNSMTQYSGSTTASFKGQDGFTSGKLEGYEFTQDGILQLNYTNGNTEDLFQLALGRVDNKGGLTQEGDNMFSATEQSGSLRLGRAGEEFNINVVSGALEQSNVDLATQFSELITAQRGYQASARVITTSDEVLQETVQLKR